MLDSIETIKKQDTSKYFVFCEISKILCGIIEKNTPCTWISSEEPFINMYNGNISYDYSGEVVLATSESMKIVKDNLGKSEYATVCCTSNLDELLDTVYINRWEASYISNCGKNWITYKKLLEEEFTPWIYNNYKIYNEETEEENEELEQELNDLLYSFIEETSYELYFERILHSIKGVV